MRCRCGCNRDLGTDTRFGMTHACYQRWVYHGRPEDGAPQAGAVVAGRIEDYAELRSWGLSREQAATRMNLSIRTLARYDSRIRADTLPCPGCPACTNTRGTEVA